MAADDIGLQFMKEHFKDRLGFLIDIGAHDGVVKGSMSRDFIISGWHGLLVEPLPEAYCKLEEAYKNDPNTVCVQAACSDSCGEAELFPCLGVSTLEAGWRDACDAWWSHVNYGPSITVAMTTLKELMKIHNIKHIDILQIDTEGHDLKVLKGMDWAVKPELICVEIIDMANPLNKENGMWLPPKDMDDYLLSVGYTLALTTKDGNGIYLRSI